MTVLEAFRSTCSRFTFNFTSLGNVQVPIIIETWNNFDNNGKLLAYDATFKWWDWTVDYLFTIAQKVFNQPDRASTQTAVAKALAGSICKTASTYCNVSLTGYENADDCNTFLLNDVRFGEPYELGMLNLHWLRYEHEYRARVADVLQDETRCCAEWCIRAWSLFDLTSIAPTLA